MNPFVQRIGMWYTEWSHAERVFDYMYQWYINDDNISRIVKNNREMFITFRDGSWIRFFPANEFIRGLRCSDSYLIDNITPDFVKKVIVPCTICGGGGIWLLDTEDEDSIYSSIAFRRQKWTGMLNKCFDH